MADLPKSKIVVKDGKVQTVEEWALWNGTPFKTILIERTVKGFSSSIGDPEHGVRNRQGKKLDDVIVGLHKDVQAKYRRLFQRRNVTPARLQKEFSKYTVEVS